jgi:hypothetical protein
VYVYVVGYTYRPVWDAFCGRTLYPGRAILLDQLLAYSDVIDETRRDELAQHPKLSKVEAERWRGGVKVNTYYVGKLILYLNVPWRG